jgi:hypothetical protein
MINLIGWLTVLIGGIIGIVPTMVYQVWNGASLLGLLIVIGGGYILIREEANV